MSTVYLHTWRCTRCDVSWARDAAVAGFTPCWYCGSDAHVGPSIDECVAGGVLEVPPPAAPLGRRLPADLVIVGRGLPADLVIIDEVHEWSAELLDEIANSPQWQPPRGPLR